jgi:hypothetical protein
MKVIFKNQGIRVFSFGIMLMSIIAFGGFVQSCSDEDYNNSSINSPEANLIVLEYLELQNDQYILNLSEGAAFAMGISKIDYDRIQKEIFAGNALIRECQAKGGQIVLNDPQKNQVNIANIRLKNNKEQTQNGIIPVLSCD